MEMKGRAFAYNTSVLDPKHLRPQTPFSMKMPIDHVLLTHPRLTRDRKYSQIPHEPQDQSAELRRTSATMPNMHK